jgi:hypothetical protein
VDLGGRGEEVTGGWKELRNEELHLFLSPVEEGEYAVYVGNRERKKPLGRHRHRRR